MCDFLFPPSMKERLISTKSSYILKQTCTLNLLGFFLIYMTFLCTLENKLLITESLVVYTINQGLDKHCLADVAANYRVRKSQHATLF